MEYKVIYTDRKTVGIRVKDGTVTVRAPYGTKPDKIKSLVDKHSEWIIRAIEREKVKREKYEALTNGEIENLKRLARTYFEEKCAYYSKIMGVSYSKISITGAKGRFGSCSSRKTICFSYRLMLYPAEAREYVAVHELAHLLEMNHSKRFYQIIEKYMPDYKLRQKLLKIQKADR